jgi:hypothetical protein
MTYRPGQSVPRSGNYIVYHAQHRLAHPARVQSASFPECGICGAGVRYDLVNATTVMPVDPIEEDADFQAAAMLVESAI